MRVWPLLIKASRRYGGEHAFVGFVRPEKYAFIRTEGRSFSPAHPPQLKTERAHKKEIFGEGIGASSEEERKRAVPEALGSVRSYSIS